MEHFQILGNLLDSSPAIIVWIVALTLSSILLKKNKGRLERLLVLGSSLILASNVLGIFSQLPKHLLIGGDMSILNVTMILSLVNLFLSLLKLAGAVCLIYAIWKMFRIAGTEAVS